MKGIVLAGGTATRLFPLTIVTNKHLLPIYDRPMIYYPIETLAGMGIREVMVIVGGKSVGDVVELLGDGNHFGLDLTYRYQRGALGIAHAIGLARDLGARGARDPRRAQPLHPRPAPLHPRLRRALDRRRDGAVPPASRRAGGRGRRCGPSCPSDPAPAPAANGRGGAAAASRCLTIAAW